MVFSIAFDMELQLEQRLGRVFGGDVGLESSEISAGVDAHGAVLFAFYSPVFLTVFWELRECLGPLDRN